MVRTPAFEPGASVAVLGLGISGVAAARLALARGGRVYVSDVSDGDEQVAAAKELRGAGIDAEAGGHDMERLLAADLVVASPGIGPATPVRSELIEAGVRTIAEIDLAYRDITSRIIGVTGTNGKTTVSQLLTHVLASAGMSVECGGNVGLSLSEIALREQQPDWIVAELSSFQLADLEQFRPDVGVLLNLGPDHLDRYHGVAQYYRDKQQ
ncbi:MAG: Mur ligase family protein, partial [Gemmatimonadota bacterium]